MKIVRFFKRKSVIISASILIVVILIALFGYRQLNEPESVNLSQSTKTSTISNSYSIDLTPEHISDQYISFNYPKGMSLRSTALAGSKSVADYTFYAKDVYSWSLDIDVSSVPEGQLDELSSYIYRVDNPGEYTKQTEEFNEQQIVVITDNDFTNGFSKVAYLVHGGNIATVSLIGDDSSGTGPLAKTFSMVLNSWQWH